MPAGTKSKILKKKQACTSHAPSSTNKASKLSSSTPLPKTSHLGVTALAARLEKLEKENERLRKMNASLKESSLPVPAAMNHQEVVLIPKPAGEVGRTGATKPGYGLLEAMGMSHDEELYNVFRAYVRAQCHAFELSQGTFKDQSMERLGAICRQAKKKFTWLEAYQKDWPVKDVIKQYLQGRGYHKRRKSAEKAKSKVEARKSGLSLSDTDEDENTANFNPLVALGYNNTESEAEGSGDYEEPPIAEQMTEDSWPEVPSEDRVAADDSAICYENPVVTSDTIIHSPEMMHGSPSRDSGNDYDNSLSIFMDSKGYFFDTHGKLLEANWDRFEGKYILKDGRDMETPDYPSSFDDYESGFNDGKTRLQNCQGHWKVGNIIPKPDTFVSPRTRALGSMSSPNHTPSRIPPTQKTGPIPMTNITHPHNIPIPALKLEKSPWGIAVMGSPLSSIHDSSPAPPSQLMKAPPINLKIKIPALKVTGKSNANKPAIYKSSQMITVATAQSKDSSHATRSTLKRQASMSESKSVSKKKAKNVVKPMD